MKRNRVASISQGAPVGLWASLSLSVVGFAYLVVVGIGVSQAGLADPIVDPILAVMEVLTLLSAPLIVILLAAVHTYASEGRKALSLAALSFGTVMAGLTSGVHFVMLTSGRQSGAVVLEWPSTAYALELLAWDVFLGLALLCAAPVFQGGRLATATRRALAITGVLCLLGAVGPLLGDMTLQRMGIIGYGVGLPVACLLMAMVFRGEAPPRYM